MISRQSFVIVYSWPDHDAQIRSGAKRYCDLTTIKMLHPNENVRFSFELVLLPLEGKLELKKIFSMTDKITFKKYELKDYSA